MIYSSKDMEQQAIMITASKMCAAARTAPKAHGKDTIYTYVLTGEDLEVLAKKMEEVGHHLMGDEMSTWYGRDANCVRKSDAVVLIGAKKQKRNVPHCGFCGFNNCGECTQSQAGCAFMYVDLGIAVSSAVSVAADSRVDNRIMLSIGKTVSEMNFEKDCVWFGIPISVSGKNIFYDRGIVHK